MRTSILAASLALLTFASAQSSIAGLPKCAQKCLEPFANANGIAGCGAYDIKCICSSGGFLSNIGCCLQAECSAADQAAAIVFAGNICKTAGITVPSEIPCEATTGSATDDAAKVSSSVSSAISSATSVISEFISSKSESSESLASTLSSASSAASSAATAATTTGGGAVSSGASSAASAATSAAPNGASLNSVGGSGIIGGLVAALALL